MNETAPQSAGASPATPGPSAWRAQVRRDLASVLAGIAPRRRAVQIQRFRAGADPLKPMVPKDAQARWTAAWSSERPGLGSQLLYAVGDVHGRYDLLKALLEQIARDRAAAPEREPVLVFLGDYIDRGPDSPLVVEALVQLSERDPSGVCLLKGNHEQGLLEFLDAPTDGGPWLRFGGFQTLMAYGVAPPDPDSAEELQGARDELLALMPASHLRRLQTLEAMATIGGYVFVHAGVAPGRPLAAQREAELLWIREGFLEAARPAAKVVVHGHTWTSAAPELREQRIGVDTGAYATGVLTAVRLDGAERRVLQARDPDASWAGAEPTGPRLISRPQDFRRLDWSVDLSFSAAGAGRAGPAARARAPSLHRS